MTWQHSKIKTKSLSYKSNVVIAVQGTEVQSNAIPYLKCSCQRIGTANNLYDFYQAFRSFN
jgi:hypothetical protein